MRRLRVLAPLALLLALLIVRARRRRPAAPPLRTRVVPPALPAAPPPGPRFLSVPWELVEAPADRPDLTVRFERATIDMELDRVDAQETATQVFVTVLVRFQPPAGDGDAAAWDAEEATVALAEPLGERELIHAPTDVDRAADGPL
jgi:hypothetical protein